MPTVTETVYGAVYESDILTAQFMQQQEIFKAVNGIYFIALITFGVILIYVIKKWKE